MALDFDAEIDELLCSADVRSQEERCRIPLFPDKWNVWLMAIRVTEDLTQRQITDEIFALMGQALTLGKPASLVGIHFDPWFKDDAKNVSNLSVGFFMPDEYDPEAEEIWDADKLDAEMQHVFGEEASSIEVVADVSGTGGTGFPSCPAIEINTPPITFAIVSFFYRGTNQEMRWPLTKRIRIGDLPLAARTSLLAIPGIGPTLALDGDNAVMDIWCTKDPDYSMVEAYSPPNRPAPKEDDEKGIDWGNLIIPGSGEGTLEDISDTAKYVGVGLLALAVTAVVIAVK